MSREEITRLVRSAGDGDHDAAERLWRQVYDELRAMARGRLRRGAGGAPVQPTALVHDAWLRLGGDVPLSFESSAAFFRAAASAMRNALVDELRREGRLKRGGAAAQVPLEGLTLGDGDEGEDVLELHDALERLQASHPRVAELVELRYFAGLTMDEAARALGTSVATAERDWRFGRAWLRRSLAAEEDTGGTSES